MGVNKYFDESKIIKKNQTIPNEEIKVETEDTKIETEKVEEPTEIIIENFDQGNLNIPDQNINVEIDLNKQINEYKNVISQHNNVQKKPIYSISRQNGKVKIEPKDKPVQKEVKEEVVIPLTYDELYNQELEKIKALNQNNIIKAKIEISIYKQLIKNEANSDKNRTYLMRLDNFMNDLDFHIKRQNILEKM